MPCSELRARTLDLLGELGVPPSTYPASQPQRALFTNRTLSLRSIQAIGYDMVRLMALTAGGRQMLGGWQLAGWQTGGGWPPGSLPNPLQPLCPRASRTTP